MTLRTFEKNYEVRLLKIQALKKNIILVSVLVKKKGTDLYDTYSWTPDCLGAEPWLGTFFDGYESVDMVVMEYIQEKIWFKLPCDLADSEEIEIAENIEK
jgi:hypothetical protein